MHHFPVQELFVRVRVLELDLTDQDLQFRAHFFYCDPHHAWSSQVWNPAERLQTTGPQGFASLLPCLEQIQAQIAMVLSPLCPLNVDLSWFQSQIQSSLSPSHSSSQPLTTHQLHTQHTNVCLMGAVALPDALAQSKAHGRPVLGLW